MSGVRRSVRIGGGLRLALALPLALALMAPSAGSARSAPVAVPRTGAGAPAPPARAGSSRSAPMTVTINAGRPGAPMPSDFVGLSFETPVLGYPVIASPTSNLVNLLRSLGTGQLRFGGDSLDRTQWLPATGVRAPWAVNTVTPANLASVAGVVRAAGWRVLLGLNLGHLDPASAGDEARTAASLFGTRLDGVEIGNEPDRFTVQLPEPFRFLGADPLRPAGWGPANYAAEVASVRTAVAGAGVTAPLYGPDTALTHSLPDYYPPGSSVVTDHLYPASHCKDGIPLSPGPSVSRLLGGAVSNYEDKSLDHAIEVARGRHLPLRIDEVNSVSCGGQVHTSDAFASALWAVDFALRAASRGAIGVNFHGGVGPCLQGGQIQSPWYSPLCAAPSGALVPRPEYYGLLLLRQLEGSALIPVAYRDPRGHRVTAYAFLGSDRTVRVVVDDLDAGERPSAAAHGHEPPRPVAVTLVLSPSYRAASVLRLTAPSAYATDSIRFGGAVVRGDGTFAGAVPEPVRGGGGRFGVKVEPGSAVVVALTG